jgi:hypothetical protein
MGRISLSALGGGEGRVRWGIAERRLERGPAPSSPSHRCAMGPSLSPLKGGEGLLQSFLQFARFARPLDWEIS